MAVALHDDVEEAVDVATTVVTKEKKHCEICGKSYVYSRALKTHMKEKHPEALAS